MTKEEAERDYEEAQVLSDKAHAWIKQNIELAKGTLNNELPKLVALGMVGATIRNPANMLISNELQDFGGACMMMGYALAKCGALEPTSVPKAFEDALEQDSKS